MGKRIRTLKPEFYDDESVQGLPREVRYTFVSLFYYADDYGRASANPALIRSAIYPMDTDVDAEMIDAHLVKLEDAGLVKIYDVGSRTYLWIVDWFFWQRVDKPTDSRLPQHPDDPLTGIREQDKNIREPFASRRGPLVGEGRRGKEGGEGEEVGPGGAGGPGRAGQGGAPSRVTFQPDEPSSRDTSELPPPDHCGKHPNGTDTPCWGCRNARIKAEEWVTNHLGMPDAPTFAPVDDDDDPDYDQ